MRGDLKGWIGHETNKTGWQKIAKYRIQMESGDFSAEEIDDGNNTKEKMSRPSETPRRNTSIDRGGKNNITSNEIVLPFAHLS